MLYYGHAIGGDNAFPSRSDTTGIAHAGLPIGFDGLTLKDQRQIHRLLQSKHHYL